MLLEAQLEKQAESTLYAQEITEVSFTPSRSRRRHTLLVYRLMFIRYRIAIRSKMMFVCVCVSAETTADSQSEPAGLRPEGSPGAKGGTHTGRHMTPPC